MAWMINIICVAGTTDRILTRLKCVLLGDNFSSSSFKVNVSKVGILAGSFLYADIEAFLDKVANYHRRASNSPFLGPRLLWDSNFQL